MEVLRRQRLIKRLRRYLLRLCASYKFCAASTDVSGTAYYNFCIASVFPSSASSADDVPKASTDVSGTSYKFRTASSRSNPSQVPRAPSKSDNNNAAKEIYRPRSAVVASPVLLPPLASACEFVVVDDGNASPRLLRPTTYAFPTTKKISKDSGIPLALLVTPFADCPSCEEVPVIKNQKEPLRCHRCHAYLNPWVKWSVDGSSWECNMCSTSNNTPQWYQQQAYVNSSSAGMYDQMYGTVDVQVGDAYCTRPPVKAMHLFAIDCSDPLTLDMGLEAVRAAAVALGEKYAAVPVKPTVGFFVFDAIMRFFRVRGEEVSLEVVPDAKDSPFAGLPAVSFCYPVDVDGLKKLDMIMKSVKKFIEKTPPPRSSVRLSCGGAAIAALHDACDVSGGKGYLISCGRPKFGKGALRARENMNFYTDRDEEVDLFKPLKMVSSTSKPNLDKEAAEFYEALSESMAKSQVCLDIFTCPEPEGNQPGKEQDYCDSATLSKLCARTGGQYHLLKNCPTAAFAEALQFEVLRSATRNSGNEAIVKVRTSQGIMVKGFLSPCGVTHTHAGSCEIEMAACDADKSICVELELEGNGIKINSMAFFQAATLFTDAGGVRTVRISTLAVPSATEVQVRRILFGRSPARSEATSWECDISARTRSEATSINEWSFYTSQERSDEIMKTA
ncbi:hypothetical protein TL16_g02475 [Triparma laevis f. inornata]|uniref:Protein transport protein SEC23 n=1 Tax=Triparma laevis f. inornata TaxID=1714386 RepID=A0A9W7DWP4_9STRA|nr:hypothetical protein TL16_g02475 [Triparma laevis f. inornata]